MTALPILFDASVSSWIHASRLRRFMCRLLHSTSHQLNGDNVSNLPTITICLKGVSPLLCHNGQTADQRNTYAKAIKAVSSKRKKTDADYDELARLEWLAGLYCFGDELVIPDYVLESTMIGGAKKSKRGPQAKCGMFFTKHAVLEFNGKPAVINDDTLAEMFASGDFTHTIGVKVGMSKIMRTRPMFRNWSCQALVQYDPDVLNHRDIEELAIDAGKLVGMGDWRPKHGRFDVEVI